jgi:hypothetical protein
MLYGPDDKPIPRPVTPLERWYSKRALEILRDKCRLSDAWGVSRLVDQYGRPIPIPWKERPIVGNMIKGSGRTIQFYRKVDPEITLGPGNQQVLGNRPRLYATTATVQDLIAVRLGERETLAYRGT